MLDATDNNDTDVPMSDADSRNITDEHGSIKDKHGGIKDNTGSYITSESDSIGVATPDSISCMTISDDENGDGSESGTDTSTDQNVGDDTHPQDESNPAPAGNPAHQTAIHTRLAGCVACDKTSDHHPNVQAWVASILTTAAASIGGLPGLLRDKSSKIM
ncbi:hypothetical protein F5Y14DRAFT_448318 [Nemania sp. NC0429]|nr:hypothetical protein F5Y14DRAFT_448318 [Nemania sp. NC0429]